jgi:hypothetical protein
LIDSVSPMTTVPLRPDQPGDAVADAGGLVHPAGLVPAGDQHLAPFLGHRARHARGSGLGQRAQRIAVQIDHPFGQWNIARVAAKSVIGVGIVMFALALGQFRRHSTTILPREEPRTMIQTGVYRLSRNPIYLADAMILAGVALWRDAASLLLVPLFLAVIRRRFITGEEAVMRRRFGAQYDSYAARVRRWI